MNEIVVHAEASQWEGAADRGLRARQEREKLISKVLVADLHFGAIAGSQRGKPTLLKPGAEAITDALGLCPHYEQLVAIEDFDKPLFFYRYRCILRTRVGDYAVSTGIGSCNSHEVKYRWREARRACPSCGAESIIVGKQEYGGGFVCFKRAGGCGAKFPDDDQRITSQTTGRVENADVAEQLNTIDKMAQKRAHVAAVLSLGLSEQFTQDLEDMADRVDSSDQAKAAAGKADKEKALRKQVADWLLEMNDGDQDAARADLRTRTGAEAVNTLTGAKLVTIHKVIQTAYEMRAAVKDSAPPTAEDAARQAQEVF